MDKLENLAYGHRMAYQWYTRKNNYFQVPYIALNIITILSVFAVLQNADTNMIRYICLAAVILAHMVRIFQSKFSYTDKAAKHKFACNRLESVMRNSVIKKNKENNENKENKETTTSQSFYTDIRSIQGTSPHLPPFLLFEFIQATSVKSLYDANMVHPSDHFYHHMYKIYNDESSSEIVPIKRQGGLVNFVSSTIKEENEEKEKEKCGEIEIGQRPMAVGKREMKDNEFSVNSQEDALFVDQELLKRVAAISYAHYLSFLYYRIKYFMINIPATFCNGLAILFNVMQGDDPIVFAIVTALDAVMGVIEERLRYNGLSQLHETATEAYTVLADDIYFRILTRESTLEKIKQSISLFHSIQTSSPTISTYVVEYMSKKYNFNSKRNCCLCSSCSLLNFALFLRNF
jgi:hypothetical protein